MNKEFWDRVGKTFVEGFISALIVSLTHMDWNDVFSSENGTKILLSVVIGAIAMAISGVWNGVISPVMSVPKQDDPALTGEENDSDDTDIAGEENDSDDTDIAGEENDSDDTALTGTDETESDETDDGGDGNG